MKKETLAAGIIALIIGILIAPAFHGLWRWSPMMGRYSGMNNNGMMSQIDSHFIEQMIPHHEDAILMADIALRKSEHPELKTLAEDIKRTQSEEITTMREWYQSWYGTAVPASSGMGMGGGMMRGGMMGDESDPSELEAAQPFDKAFIEAMIPHHQMAVMMASMLSRSTDRPEMRQLAENIIEAQTREINQMREWHKNWYQ